MPNAFLPRKLEANATYLTHSVGLNRSIPSPIENNKFHYDTCSLSNCLSRVVHIHFAF